MPSKSAFHELYRPTKDSHKHGETDPAKRRCQHCVRSSMEPPVCKRVACAGRFRCRCSRGPYRRSQRRRRAACGTCARMAASPSPQSWRGPPAGTPPFPQRQSPRPPRQPPLPQRRHRHRRSSRNSSSPRRRPRTLPLSGRPSGPPALPPTSCPAISSRRPPPHPH